jgi:hypothetical protein
MEMSWLVLALQLKSHSITNLIYKCSIYLIISGSTVSCNILVAFCTTFFLALTET